MFATIANLLYKATTCTCRVAFEAIYWSGYTALWIIDLLKYPLHPYVLTTVAVIGGIIHYYRTDDNNAKEIDQATDTLLITREGAMSADIAYALMGNSSKVRTLNLFKISRLPSAELTNKKVVIVDVAFSIADIVYMCSYAKSMIFITSYTYNLNSKPLQEYIQSRRLIFMIPNKTYQTIYQMIWTCAKGPDNIPEPLMITYMGNRSLPQGKYINEFICDQLDRAHADHTPAETRKRHIINIVAELVSPKYNGVTISQIKTHYASNDGIKKHLPQPLYNITCLIKCGKRSYDAKMAIIELEQIIHSECVCDEICTFKVQHMVVSKSMANVALDYIMSRPPLKTNTSFVCVIGIHCYNMAQGEWVNMYIAPNGENIMSLIGITDDEIISDNIICISPKCGLML